MPKIVKESKLNPNTATGEFLWRRIHSLTGIIPLGLFLIFHLSANNSAAKSPEAFNALVDLLRGLPYLELIEIIILGVPFLFHGLYGLVITPAFARSKPLTYRRERNLAYFMQRITGIIALIFIGVHVWQFRFAEELDFEFVASALRQPLWALAYFVGITAIVYHFANGLWNFLISWGITVGGKAQKNSAIVCGGLGLIVWVIGMSALWAFFSSEPSSAAASSAEHARCPGFNLN